ncbi:MAG: NAD(P)H-hydrate dehydratase [Atopostipes suicloacalis]|nr:NAD(P)H-hydrate dehydratase [Atopostipes suicloacalis]MDN6730885.1 NAD(P)H-hydrate dehydratase [Atopostipes suicloacalis]
MDNITKEKVVDWFPIRKKDSYKNEYGNVLCVGGNKEMGGAIILSAKAALNSGAGLVTVASASENRTSLHAQVPEAMFKDSSNLVALARAIKQSDTILLGPGLGRDSDAKTIFNFVLKHVQEKQWLILDADALYFYGELSDNYQLKTKEIILTPHLGEWEKISAIKAPADHIEKNQLAVNRLNSTVVLKKARTEVYSQEQVWKNTAGNPSMATGGMGDTLAGIITGLLGQYPSKIEAILSAVYIHSAIADELAKDYYVTLPSLISQELPIFMRKLAQESRKK